MIRAYVTTITGTGASVEAVDAIRALSGVTDPHVVSGDFDIVAEIEGQTVRDLQKIVTAEVHEVEGVGTTRTYIQMD
jgi:DNA-binding Lrp family transcriptional regulator